MYIAGRQYCLLFGDQYLCITSFKVIQLSTINSILEKLMRFIFQTAVKYSNVANQENKDIYI